MKAGRSSRRRKVPRRVALLSGGGDCPGINAVVRAVCKTLIHDYSIETVGILDGFRGLVMGESIHLGWDDVSGILMQGGTILGASNRDNPYDFVEDHGGESARRDRSRDVEWNLRALGLDALVAIGGDGTLHIAARLARDFAIPVVGVPKTIDNDVSGTDFTFGFYSAVNTISDAIEKLRTTAQSHHRVMVVEVMGRNAGWLALYSGMSTGADVVLLPEIPYRLADLCEAIRERQRRHRAYSIVVVAEGAHPEGGEPRVRRRVADFTVPERLGGIGEHLAEELERETGIETRGVILGHVQRGGAPVPFDRILATRFGAASAHAVAAGRHGLMVALHDDQIGESPLAKAAAGPRRVPPEHELIRAARSLGTHFGRRDSERAGAPA